MLLTIKEKESINKFKIEVPQEDGALHEINGKIRELTEDEQTLYDARYKDDIEKVVSISKLSEEIQELTLIKDIALEDKDKRKAVEIITKLKPMQEELKGLLVGFDMELITETMIKDRYDIALTEGKEEILSLCEKYGYSLVNDTLIKAVEEGK